MLSEWMSKLANEWVQLASAERANEFEEKASELMHERVASFICPNFSYSATKHSGGHKGPEHPKIQM